MKRLFILIGMLLLAVGLNAQITSSHEAGSKNLGANQTYYEFTGSYVVGGVTADTLYWEIFTNKHTPVLCNARVEFTRKGTTDTYDADVQYKMFENSTYAALTESAANTASVELLDTSRLDLGTAGGLGRYFRVVVNDDNACAATDSITITTVAFKLYER